MNGLNPDFVPRAALEAAEKERDDWKREYDAACKSLTKRVHQGADAVHRAEAAEARCAELEKERDGLEGERNRMVRALDVLGEDWAYEKTRREAAEARVKELEAALIDFCDSWTLVSSGVDDAHMESAMEHAERVLAASSPDEKGTETP